MAVVDLLLVLGEALSSVDFNSCRQNLMRPDFEERV